MSIGNGPMLQVGSCRGLEHRPTISDWTATRARGTSSTIDGTDRLLKVLGEKKRVRRQKLVAMIHCFTWNCGWLCYLLTVLASALHSHLCSFYAPPYKLSYQPHFLWCLVDFTCILKWWRYSHFRWLMMNLLELHVLFVTLHLKVHEMCFYFPPFVCLVVFRCWWKPQDPPNEQELTRAAI